MEYEEKNEIKEGKIYNLFRCGYLEVREWLKETDIVIIPLGSMEQHGRHCPVCTDSIATELPCQIAAEMAKAAGWDINQVRKQKDTEKTSSIMIQGAIKKVRSLLEKGELDGILSFGGASNTAIATAIMQSFPFGYGGYAYFHGRVLRYEGHRHPPI